MTDDDSEQLQLSLPEQRVDARIESIEFHRDENRNVEHMTFVFRLYSGETSTLFPVGVGKVDGSLDDLLDHAYASLYAILASVAETIRKRDGFPTITFEATAEKHANPED